jgi:hypothetical protein
MLGPLDPQGVEARPAVHVIVDDVEVAIDHEG